MGHAAIGLDPKSVGDLPADFLTDVLLYHVARGRRYSVSVIASKRIRTLNQSRLYQDGGVLTDNLGREANIIVTDVAASHWRVT
jgi:hypothetical protein